MKRWFVVLNFAALAFASQGLTGTAVAAGPYDGQWNGHMSWDVHKGGGCTTADFPVTVADNKAAGEVKGRLGIYPLTGTVAQDGSFKGTLGKAPVTGKFTADSFAGIFPGPEASCGQGHLQFERAK